MTETVGMLISAKVIPARKDRRTGEAKEAIGLIEVASGDTLEDGVTQVWLDESTTRRVMRLKKFDEVVIDYEVKQYNGQPQLRAVGVRPVAVTA